ncbi:MAG: CDP-alcohol phosphatidyltransferase family protein [Spirochaeta sp.]|nr:CDP-alcohol phosphatidyltransferase family protein [Spirochaeta sp.]
MFDNASRPLKDRVLLPAVRAVPAAIGPMAITAAALVCGVGAAIAAGAGQWTVALVLFAINRILDGLDGLVARYRGAASDLGGYLDVLFDFVVYAAVPIGVWLGTGGTATLPLVVLLAVFYVNAASWMYLSAVVEKRGAGPRPLTSVVMPVGVVEGTETLVFFTLFLAVPAYAGMLFYAMAAATAVGILQRVVWAARNLPDRPEA